MSHLVWRPWPLGLLGALLLSSGCMVHRVEHDPVPAVTPPEAFSATGGEAAPTERWWTDFGDPGLDAAVARALDGNLDLQRAFARLLQADAVARQGKAALFPTVDASLGFSRSRSNFFAGEPIGKISTTNSLFNISATAAYEVDVWGKARSTKQAAALEREATRQDLEAVAAMLAANVARTWFLLAEQQALLRLLDEQLAVSRDYTDLVRLRFKQGLAGALDVRQQEQQIIELESQIPQARASVAVLRTQLAVLQGLPPEAPIALPDGLAPAPDALPAVGVPADLLNRRPDLRAARARVVAADFRVGVALADRFPSLRLSASTGFQDKSPAELFTSWIWSFVANLVGPIFDGGRRKAEVARTRAVLEDAVLAYGQSLLTALKEVEDALAQEGFQRELLVSLDELASRARLTLDEARTRYVNGLVDYLPVLSALQSLQSVERRRISASRQLVSLRVDLYRALGATWTADLSRSEAGAKGESP
ncbi:MAG: efflux transporter outer membrane subunit [Deltaproteobacteria bacterium]|nr:efflux transporter outer membrane subunit [Deltaproteobacteria bacterium]